MSITDGIQCACSSTDGNATLADLRKRLMIRLGFAAQANNPPPGMKELLNDLLQSAQVALFRRPTGEFRNVRWFSWPLTAGQRLYDYPDNDEKNGPQNCPATLDPRQVTWVGRERDGVWAEMHQGINPRSYTTSELTGLPQRYEFRNCIEIWPAPDETLGNLVIKGKFDLNRFTEDADKTTIDSEIVFLLALANGKQHYRQPDAQTYIQQLEVMISTWLPARMPRRGTSRVRRRARACMSRRVLRCRSRDRPHRHPQRGQGRHQPSAGQGRGGPEHALRSDERICRSGWCLALAPRHQEQGHLADWRHQRNVRVRRQADRVQSRAADHPGQHAHRGVRGAETPEHGRSADQRNPLRRAIPRLPVRGPRIRQWRRVPLLAAARHDVGAGQGLSARRAGYSD
ncbi:hypothetical protein SNK04_013739 [Fusarium graminearum]